MTRLTRKERTGTRGGTSTVRRGADRYSRRGRRPPLRARESMCAGTGHPDRSDPAARGGRRRRGRRARALAHDNSCSRMEASASRTRSAALLALLHRLVELNLLDGVGIALLLGFT